MTDAQRTPRGLDPAVAAELGDLLHELTHNKETRGVIASAIRKVKPESAHAQAFKDIEIEEKFEALKKEKEDAEIKAAQAEVVQRLNRQRRKLIDGDGDGRKWSEDEVKGIEALMQQKGISDYADGATLYAATLPPSSPQPGGDNPPPSGGFTFPEFDKYKDDPIRASRDMAHQVIGEFMRKRR